MANNEQDYAPQAKPADEVTKPCQEGIRVYPTRFALTDKTFENIKSKGEMPPLPKNAQAMRIMMPVVYVMVMCIF